ncbi:hypothetical protein B0I33_104328 [Prauserella shujinwangii]|uniref:Uncharacterized protein n=1 Tax=Prauserella shujinwangii TaxID=1453103 RepID=A0A2T0LWV8_9PSEU|nr:hypothetical protein [Prauserella shujinwangii]PRX48511.1 hypothetical protein B0I33_104328 [Prauserella shujinwangii]
MMGTVEHATLTCHRCGRETRHELAYAGRLLVVTTCTRCGNGIGRDVRRRYLADLRQRVASKPGRMLRRFRRHPVGFTTSLPRTTVLKPWELVEEMRLVWSAAAGTRGRETGGCRGDRH